jgi:putative ABC transport system permease protein
MLKNYLTTAIRHFRKQKAFSMINVASLTIGIACSILILLYVQYELSYDTYHKNARNIYRVVQKQTWNVWRGTDMWNATCGMLKPTLLENFPEVLKVSRVMRRNARVEHKENIFIERRFFIVEPEFLEIFSFPLVEGDLKTALEEPLSVLLTEDMAAKYFGNENPLGKTLTVDNLVYVVKGILKNIQGNSHFTFDFLASFQTLYSDPLLPNDYIEQWGNNLFSTYISLRKGVDSQEMGKKITYVIKGLRERRSLVEYHLQQVTDIHLHSNVNREFEPNSDIKYVYIFSAVAVLLILIACFNYMNLSTAQAFYRAKEVGIRKVTGADKRQITRQFLCEAVIYSMIGLLLSLFLISLILPSFSHFIERDLEFGLINDFGLTGMFIGIAVLIAFISGSYPALVLSKLQPTRVLRGSRLPGSTKTMGFRNTLVVIQFVISIAMIASTTVVYKQLRYVQNRNLGFQKENIISLYAYDSGLRRKYETFRTELLKHPGITDLTYSSSSLHYNMQGGSAWWEGKLEDDYINFYKLAVDYNFFDFHKIKLLEGRSFSKEMTTDTHKAYILNKTAVNAIGWEKPLGKLFRHWIEEKGEVIGVVSDFHFQSLHLKIEPLIIAPGRFPSDRAYFSIKIRAEDVPGTLSFIEKKYKEFSPGYPFDWSFLDDRLNSTYRTEQKLGMIFTYFTAIAIVIACLGLFGLGAFTAEKRTKEIGIRKVLGASASGIIFLLSKEFMKWVILAAVIALPMAWYAMSWWLENFAYRTRIGLEVIILAFITALIISFVSVGYKSYKAATANPVDSLRYE